MTQGPHEGDQENGRPIVRDRRRIDPKTYQVRDPEAAESAPAGQVTDQQGAAPAVDRETEQLAAEMKKLKTELADRTSDLQRVQAEYINYKRRVDRDRDLARASGVEAVLRDLLGVLDSISAARDHGELTGGFKGVADEIEKLAARYGLESFGEPGDPFDPRVHEALMHAQAEGITGPTAVTILQSGYKLKDRVIRPARVAVAEPSEPDTVTEEAADGDGSAEQV
ncbi:MAG: nucleotide exchange factor GrpE [Microlunatus sp.]|nr:nucleotide exchange factor GrpE [Microlunatus sp.]